MGGACALLIRQSAEMWDKPQPQYVVLGVNPPARSQLCWGMETLGLLLAQIRQLKAASL